MAKKTRRTEQRADVDRRSDIAKYDVKDHGHRFFKISVALDPDTGEIYLPDGYKFVSFLGTDSGNPGKVTVILKDEHLG